MRTFHLTNPPQFGEDVIPLQKALHKARLYNGSIDGIFNASTALACYKAKWRLGYAKKQVNRTGGQLLLDYLQGNKKLTLVMKARRKKRGYGLKKLTTKRNAIVMNLLWGVSNEPRIHYAQIRPMPLKKKLPLRTDCSGFTTLCYYLAGAPNPNTDTNKYDGEGYTGTMLAHGQEISLHDAKAGDLIIWGKYPGYHVVALVEDGHVNNGDPYVVSHGQESGPKKLRFNIENAAQALPYTVKRYIKD